MLRRHKSVWVKATTHNPVRQLFLKRRKGHVWAWTRHVERGGCGKTTTRYEMICTTQRLRFNPGRQTHAVQSFNIVRGDRAYNTIATGVTISEPRARHAMCFAIGDPSISPRSQMGFLEVLLGAWKSNAIHTHIVCGCLMADSR